jgi:hypothetical protein
MFAISANLILVISVSFAVALPDPITRSEDGMPTAMNPQFESIGQATMEADGTIVLYLRAQASGSAASGDAVIRYPPDHPQYRSILEHLGGLRPGQTKPVRPWN